ncbi:MAG: hypothetical protein HY958_09205 [Bacteroidia bacterium]|nr:hypothetical protein [Bacteroidia bacterium]
MKILIQIIALIILSNAAFSQAIDDYYIKPDKSDTDNTPLNTTTLNDKPISLFDKTPLSDNKKLQVRFQTGVSFASFGGANIFNTWVAPEVKYQLTPKFNLKVGTVAMYSNMSDLQNYIYHENSVTPGQRLAQYFMYAQGEYKVNDKIRLRGTSMREFSDLSINPHPFSLNHLGVDIKLKEKVFLSADIQFAKGNFPYGMYYNGPFGNPYSCGTQYSFSPFGSCFNQSGW